MKRQDFSKKCFYVRIEVYFKHEIFLESKIHFLPDADSKLKEKENLWQKKKQMKK